MSDWKSARGAADERANALARFSHLRNATGAANGNMKRVKSGRQPPPRSLRRAGGYRAAELYVEPDSAGDFLRMFVIYRHHESADLFVALTFVTITSPDFNCGPTEAVWDLARTRAESLGL